MKIIGNILWLILGGFVIAVEYFIGSLALIVTVIGIPFGLQTFKMGYLAIWPFGRTSIVTERSSGCIYVLMNVLWLICGGIWIALTHAFIGFLLYITIIGIPFGRQHFKLTEVALNPFGREIVGIK